MTSSSSFAALDRFVAALEYRIQAAIAQTTTQVPPTIRCRFQQGRLLVLAEDSQIATSVEERDARFKTLALAMGTGLAETELPEELLDAAGELPVRLYLRKRGTASPYAARSWGWKPADALSDLFDQPASGNGSQRTKGNDEGLPGSLVLLSSRDPDDPLSIDEKISLPNPSDRPPPFWSSWQSFSFKQWQPYFRPAHLQERWHTLTEPWQELPWRSVGGLVAAGLAVGAIAYVFSRPCLVGSCERRQVASDLSQSALSQLDNNPVPEQVTQAHKELQKAVNLLSAIPAWSPHYDVAQAELSRYRIQLADLDWIVAAQESATLAAEKSQNPPHPVPVWVEVHLLWQKAVNHLRRVPADSPVLEFAQQKLVEYEANYAAIGKRLTVEEKAEANLNLAVQAGQVATSKTESAATLADWLVAQQEWEKAISSLGKIPKGTLAYEEARSLLSEFRSKQVQTRTRVTFEKSGERAYQEALASAAEAQTAAQRNQWTQAVDNWSQAYAQMRQVPKNTLRYAEAQSLLTAYQESLKQAQAKLKQAVALQTIEGDLEELCPVDTGICTYSLGNQQIELILRDPYDAAVRQSISPPSTQGHMNQSNGVVEETHQLVQNIMRLGNRVQLPITLYDVNGQFIARYKPEHGGFVKQ